MENRKRLNVRIDSDLYAHLHRQPKKNMTSYVESLIVKGLMMEMGEMYENALNQSQEVYKNALQEARNEKLESLNSKLENIDEQLEMQADILINLCLSQGAPKERIKKFADEIDENDEVFTKNKFVSRLVIELARANGFSADTIKSWLRHA